MFTVVGEVLVDLVGQSPQFTAYPGGSPYNVAITLARLGAPAALVARTGRDEFGAMLEAKARESGVSFELWQVVDEPTTLAVASLDANGSAHYDFYFDGTAGLGWDDSLVGRVPMGGVLHLSSIATWRPPSAQILQALQRRAYASGNTLVSYDPNVRPAVITDRGATRASIERAISAAHLVKASDEDVAFLYPSTELADVAKRWCELGAAIVVVTLGSAGAVAFGTHGELAREPGEQITVADTVGAGDSFAAGLLAALGAVRPSELAERIPAALRQAVVVSAMTCERNGADPPTRAELDERLKARGG
ncbi:MAG TPA: carbohydrate kinase [Jatrophihabitantaceae bacterium]|nr:carbohydrate kinase [Jatrophihabitantaceae bacterium]